MIKLSLPKINNEELLDNVIKNKRRVDRKLIAPYIAEIKERYNFYIVNNIELEKILPLVKWNTIKDVLISCYSKNIHFENARLILKYALPKIIESKCPYCMINRHNTLDHYFDKSTYPEFSIFTPNLIPCCTECNTKKGVQVFNSHGNRCFIHFYFDDIPIEQFLFIRLSLQNTKIPKIEILLSFSLYSNISTIIQSHFDSLDLFGKYKSALNEKLSIILEELRELSNKFSIVEIKSIVETRLVSLRKIYGNNYWETSLYEGVLNSENFIEELML